jgi:hypothetical protein
MIPLLFSCSGSVASYEFDDYKWDKNNPIALEFESSKGENKNLSLEIRSIFGIPYKVISLNFILEKPNGEKIEFSKEVNFNEENLNCSGDFCDQKVLILNDLKLEEGKYSLNISHYNMDVNLYGLMEFRLIEE